MRYYLNNVYEGSEHAGKRSRKEGTAQIKVKSK